MENKRNEEKKLKRNASNKIKNENDGIFFLLGQNQTQNPVKIVMKTIWIAK